MSWIIQGNQLVNTENTFDMPQAEMVSECVWKVNRNTLRTGILPDDMPQAKMTSPCIWKINENTLRTGVLPDDMQAGAFANANHLKKVTIPESVSYIGEFAFRNTILSDVKISMDCVYFPTSFPDGCDINFYPYETNFITADSLELWSEDGYLFQVKEVSE